MKSILAGEAVTVAVPFTRDGEPFIPDVASVTYSLRGQDGTVMAGFSNVAVTTNNTTTKVFITIAAPETVTTLRYEKRTLIVKGTRSGGIAFQQTYHFRVTPWLTHTRTNDDVRAFIGVGPDELPDDTLDLVASYISLEAKLTQANLDAALLAGGLNEMLVNDALVAQAVLDVLPALKQRLLIMKADGPLKAQRDKIDLEQVRGRAFEKLSQALTAVGGGDPNMQDVLIQLITPTDPITGV